MTKYSVKKPFTVFVAVIVVLVIGFVSLTSMKTSLLPDMDMPYMLVITTYPGASPEKVESEVTKPLEGTLGTINGVEDVSSTSAENYSMITLQFADDTDMDSAMVKVSSSINSVESQLPELCGTPNIMELSMDMMATMYVSVSKEDTDIYELSDFTEETVIPYFERQEGVATVSDVGLVEKMIEVRLNESRIDDLNEEILMQTNDKLAEAKSGITEAEDQLSSAESELSKQENELSKTQSDTTSELADASLQLDQAAATKAAYNSQLTSLQASKTALEAEKKAYTDNGVQGSYDQLNTMFSGIRDSAAQIVSGAQSALQAAQSGMAAQGTNQTATSEMTEEQQAAAAAQAAESAANVDLTALSAMAAIDTEMLPADIKDAIDHPDKLEYFKTTVNLLAGAGYVDSAVSTAAAGVDTASLTQVYDIINTRIPQIDTELANLEIEIMAAQKVVDTINAQMGTIDEAYKTAEAGKISAAAGFGSGSAQIAAGKTALEDAKSELEDAKQTYEDSVEAARKSANLDSLLSIDTLSSLIYAQNFSMPAGYVDDENDSQWILKVGENYDSIEALEAMVLCNVDGIGDISLSDVADITVIDNAGDAYAKVNGEQGILLAIYKGSTAGTSDVSETCKTAIEEMEADYPGLDITPLVDQGDYISIIIESLASNMLIGALLAIVILAIFLMDIRPTLVVAFSIPFSVLTAIVIMYFTDVSINMMSLAGLALAVGMLVDNSIVVIENIYRLRHRGLEAPRAAVQGAKQVSGAIIASTLTTVCVFFPMVFTTGLVRQLMLPFALTISFALVASLVVALTVVPTMGSIMLKNTVPKRHKFMNKVQDIYEKILRFCLKVKILPLGIAAGLLIFCIMAVMQMGVTLIPDMGSDQISVNVTFPEDIEKDEAYAKADEVLEKIMAVDNVGFVGGMDVGSMAGIMGSAMSAGTDSYDTFTFYVIPEEGISDIADINLICDSIEESVADVECESIEVSNSMMGDTESLLGSGLELEIYGQDLETLTKISEDIMGIVEKTEGFENVTNGQEEADEELHLVIDRDEAMRLGLTTAQIYQEITDRLTTENTAVTLTVDDTDMDVTVVDETNLLTKENILDMEFETTSMDDEGNQVTETHKLDEFANLETGMGVASIERAQGERMMSVTADTAEGYNTTLLTRELEKELDSYELPDGYSMEFGGESSNVSDMIMQMGKLMLLGFLLIYLVMVAQFQSLLSPFIVIFTVPLAFTGGLLGLLLTGEQISLMSLIGFLVLMGTVVNNGIVFVDYTNQLRLGGMSKKEALVATGKTRMRPILMTAFTTILAMMAMIFGKSTGSEMGRGMAIVVTGGLIYATFMTLFIIPVLYDILYRKQPKEIDVGDESLDDVPDDAAEFIAELEEKRGV